MLYIVRHGQTELNSRHVLQGRSDHTLNETGEAQARAAAERLRGIRFDRVFSSPLRRAVRTAQLIVPGVTPVLDERLIEMDYGPYEGADLHRLPPEVLTFFSDFVRNPAPAGMERLEAVVARAGDFLETLRGSEENILISTHAIAMKGILEYLTPESGGAYWSRFIGNCEIYVSRNQSGHFTRPVPLSEPEPPL